MANSQVQGIQKKLLNCHPNHFAVCTHKWIKPRIIGSEPWLNLYVSGSKLLLLGMVIPPLLGKPCNGYINPYYKVDDHCYYRKTMENTGTSVPSTYNDLEWQNNLVATVACDALPSAKNLPSHLQYAGRQTMLIGISIEASHVWIGYVYISIIVH